MTTNAEGGPLQRYIAQVMFDAMGEHPNVDARNAAIAEGLVTDLRFKAIIEARALRTDELDEAIGAAIYAELGKALEQYSGGGRLWSIVVGGHRCAVSGDARQLRERWI